MASICDLPAVILFDILMNISHIILTMNSFFDIFYMIIYIGGEANDNNR